jgi:sec-independent protein translocase protein TatA
MGTQELIIIFLIVFLLFGASRLPQLGSSLGSAIRNFKKGFAGGEEPPAQNPQASNLPPGQSSTVEADKSREKQG